MKCYNVVWHQLLVVCYLGHICPLLKEWMNKWRKNEGNECMNEWIKKEGMNTAISKLNIIMNQWRNEWNEWRNKGRQEGRKEWLKGQWKEESNKEWRNE